MVDFSGITLQVASSSGLVSSLFGSLGPLIPQVGGGAAAGYFSGWVVKKVAKIIMYIITGVIGLFVLATAVAEEEGWITLTIHWDAIYASVQGFSGWVASMLGSSTVSSIASSVLANLTAFTGPALLFGYLEFKRG